MTISDQELLRINNSNYVKPDELINMIKWFNENELEHILRVLGNNQEEIKRLLGGVQVLHELSSEISPNEEKVRELSQVLESIMLSGINS